MAFTKTNVRLVANVGGQTIDVESFVASYIMDSIPRATATLATGANMLTLQRSLAHALSTQNVVQIPTQIVASFRTPSSDDGSSIILNGDFVLFEGYATGLGDSISKATSGLTLELTHWLSDLNYGSSISARSHPLNPAQFSFNAAIPDAAEGGSDLKHFGPITMAQTRIDDNAVRDDLWGKGILLWFKDLASIERINIPELMLNDTPDKRVQQALDRFDGFKLPMDKTALDVKEAAEAISTDIALMTLDGMANITLWDKLVGELGPTYMFSVIPGPTWAKVVPFVPGLQSPWTPGGGITIPSRDYENLETGSQMRRLLAAVGLVGDLNYLAGGKAEPSVDESFLSLAGKFVASSDGMVMLKNLPRWLSLAGLPYRTTDASSGVAGPVSTAADPAAAKAPTVKEATATDLSELTDALARTLYVYDELRGRTGRIAGPLRLDICPGSTISYAGRRYRFSDPDSANVRFATVVGVHLMLNAQSQQAATILDLAHHRSSAENTQNRTSIAKHPLYSQIWKGDYLAKELRRG